MGKKRCLECKQIKLIRDFKRKQSIWCRECSALPVQRYFSNFPDGNAMSWAHYHIRKAYKISPKQVDRLWYFQNGKCAICDNETKLVIDHDHKSERVRGLLCNACNIRLGQLHDLPNKNLETEIRFWLYLQSPPAMKIKLRRKHEWYQWE